MMSTASPNYPWTCVARSMQLHGSQLPKGQTGAEKNEKGGFRAALFYSLWAAVRRQPTILSRGQPHYEPRGQLVAALPGLEPGPLDPAGGNTTSKGSTDGQHRRNQR